LVITYNGSSKKNGKLKICVDYKKLNATPKNDPYPLPFIDEVINTIARHDTYSFLDGYFGYTMIQIRNNLCNKLGSFYLGNDSFWSEKWTSYLSKGNLSRTFRDYLNKFMKIFLDDFNIYTDMGTHIDKFKLCF
jgi:hypothetical protein